MHHAGVIHSLSKNSTNWAPHLEGRTLAPHQLSGISWLLWQYLCWKQVIQWCAPYNLSSLWIVSCCCYLLSWCPPHHSLSHMWFSHKSFLMTSLTFCTVYFSNLTNQCLLFSVLYTSVAYPQSSHDAVISFWVAEAALSNWRIWSLVMRSFWGFFLFVCLWVFLAKNVCD